MFETKKELRAELIAARAELARSARWPRMIQLVLDGNQGARIMDALLRQIETYTAREDTQMTDIEIARVKDLAEATRNICEISDGTP